MSGELSSNWKKLQAKIKAESAPASSSSPAQNKPRPNKRKATDSGVATAVAQVSRSKKQKIPAGKAASSPSHVSKPAARPKSTQMGVTQSSAVTKGTPATITPSLALWAEDNDISPEALAEAYSLGLKPTQIAPGLTSAPPVTNDRHRENEGLAPNLEVGKYVAVDCEMVGIEPGGLADALARVSIVDFHGRQVYDSLVQPRPGETVCDYRTAITGLTARSLRPASARPFDAVQADVAALLRGRVLVGHDLRHDLAALRLRHPPEYVRDTARFQGFRQHGTGRRPALRVLARELLGLEIQGAAHSSVEDARVAMLLFRKRKPEFDVAHAGKYGMPSAAAATGGEPGSSSGSNAKVKGKKKKGKGNGGKKKKR